MEANSDYVELFVLSGSIYYTKFYHIKFTNKGTTKLTHHVPISNLLFPSGYSTKISI